MQLRIGLRFGRRVGEPSAVDGALVVLVRREGHGEHRDHAAVGILDDVRRAVLDAVHETTRRWVLLAPTLVYAELRERLMPDVEQRRGTLEIIARGRTAGVVAQHRSAACEQRRVVVGVGERALALGGLLRFRLSLGDEEDHDHDERASCEVPAAHRRMEPREREDHGRNGLDAAQKARLDGACVVHALQIQHVGSQGAHDHDGNQRRDAAERQVHRHGPRLHHHRGGRSAEQHGKARHQHGAPLLQHAHGHEGVERQSHGRHEAPGQSLGGDGQLVDLALRGDDQHAAQREHEACRLASTRQALGANAHVQHDEHEPHLLDGSAHAGTRVRDGVQVAELGQQHAEYGERRDLRERAPVSEHRYEIAPVAHRGKEQEEHGGDDHAHAGDPRGGSAVVVHEQLGARAREAPADAARKRAYDAAHNMTVPRHRFRHLNRTLFPHALSAVCKAGIVARPADAVKGVSRDRRKTPASGRKDPSACVPYSRPSSSIFFTKAPV